MSSNLITLSVGQCGNQLGDEFWKSLCREHGIGADGYQAVEAIPAADNKDTFFYEADNGRYVPRAVLVDLEPRVINTIRNTAYGGLFNPENQLSGEEGGGAGNKWTEGYMGGKRYSATILDMLRREAENADKLDGFIMSHSVNGGTGSGMGSRLLEYIRHEFPKKLMQTYSVFPSDSDVVVGPYNTVLTLRRLKEFSDQVVVVDNRALNKQAAALCAKPTYAHTNFMVSTVLTASTAPLRFYGSTFNRLGYQIAELCPLSSMNFTQPGYTPFCLPGGKTNIIKTSTHDTLSRLLRPDTMMVTRSFEEAVTSRKSAAAATSTQHCMIAGLSILQGNIAEHEVLDALIKVEQQQKLSYPSWSNLTLSAGVCAASPYVKREHKVSGVLLANHTSIVNMLNKIHTDFRAMYNRKVYFEQFVDSTDAQLDLAESASHLLDVCDAYNSATKADYLHGGGGSGSSAPADGSGKENCVPASMSSSTIVP